LHIPAGNGISHLQQTVGQGAFAVINVGNYAEVSNSIHLIFSLETAKLSNIKRKTVRGEGRFIEKHKTILL